MLDLIVTIVQVVAIFVVPLLIMRFRDNKLTRTFGTIGIAYFLGLLVAIAVFLLQLAGLPIELNSDVGEIGSYVCIALAIPLLLFPTNLLEVRSLARDVLVAFIALLGLAALVAIAVNYLYGESLNWGSQLCAMAIGLYTGGTPNFNAIGVTLGVDPDVIALGNLSDMFVGGVFYIFLLLAAKPLLSRFLKSDTLASDSPAHRADGSNDILVSGPQPGEPGEDATNVDEFARFKWSRSLVLCLLLAFAIVVVGAGIGIGIWFAGGQEGAMTDPLIPAIMITGTVLGIAFSFVKRVRQTPGCGAVGHYLILVFSFALASCLNLRGFSAAFLRIFVLLAAITVAIFVLHVIVCRLLRIDADTCITTATAGLYGPAFIPAITGQLKRNDLTAPGLICGSLGYAVGTFLGLLVFVLL